MWCRPWGWKGMTFIAALRLYFLIFLFTTNILKPPLSSPPAKGCTDLLSSSWYMINLQIRAHFGSCLLNISARTISIDTFSTIQRSTCSVAQQRFGIYQEMPVHCHQTQDSVIGCRFTFHAINFPFFISSTRICSAFELLRSTAQKAWNGTERSIGAHESQSKATLSTRAKLLWKFATSKSCKRLLYVVQQKHGIIETTIVFLKRWHSSYIAGTENMIHARYICFCRLRWSTIDRSLVSERMAGSDHSGYTFGAEARRGKIRHYRSIILSSPPSRWSSFMCVHIHASSAYFKYQIRHCLFCWH